MELRQALKWLGQIPKKYNHRGLEMTIEIIPKDPVLFNRFLTGYRISKEEANLALDDVKSDEFLICGLNIDSGEVIHHVLDDDRLEGLSIIKRYS